MNVEYLDTSPTQGGKSKPFHNGHWPEGVSLATFRNLSMILRESGRFRRYSWILKGWFLSLGITPILSPCFGWVVRKTDVESGGCGFETRWEPMEDRRGWVEATGTEGLEKNWKSFNYK